MQEKRWFVKEHSDSKENIQSIINVIYFRLGPKNKLAQMDLPNFD